MPAVFLPWCGASSEKCLLLWHHFLSKTVIYGHFLTPNDSIVFEQGNKSSPLNFTQYNMLPHNKEIVLWTQITVTSLHPMYVDERACWQLRRWACEQPWNMTAWITTTRLVLIGLVCQIVNCTELKKRKWAFAGLGHLAFQTCSAKVCFWGCTYFRKHGKLTKNSSTL